MVAKRILDYLQVVDGTTVVNKRLKVVKNPAGLMVGMVSTVQGAYRQGERNSPTSAAAFSELRKEAAELGDIDRLPLLLRSNRHLGEYVGHPRHRVAVFLMVHRSVFSTNYR